MAESLSPKIVAPLAARARTVRRGTTGTSEIWQARINRELAEELRADALVLGIEGRTDIVKAALELLHRQAAEERMALSIEKFYGDSTPPLPLGVVPADANP